MHVSIARSAQNISNMPEPPKHLLSEFGYAQTNFQVARTWNSRGIVLADVSDSSDRASRLAHLNVSFGLMAQPQVPWAARFWESDAPPGVQPIEWLFGSKTSVSCLEDALALLDKTRGLVTAYAIT